MLRLLFSFLLASTICLALHAQSPLPRPATYTPITDPTNKLSDDQRRELWDSLRAFEKEQSTQICAVILDNLGGQTVETYAADLFQNWQIGQTQSNNGVLLLIALSERKVRIEVGYGLEDKLTDAVSANIIAEKITPNLKANNFYLALRDGLSEIRQRVRGEPAVRRQLTRAAWIESLWLKLLASALVLVWLLRDNLKIMTIHLVAATLFLALTERSLWRALNFEPDSAAAAAALASLISLGLLLPSMIFFSVTDSKRQLVPTLAPTAPFALGIHFVASLAIGSVLGLAYANAISYTLHAVGLVFVWTWTYKSIATKAKPSDERPTFGGLVAELSFYYAVLLLGLLLFLLLLEAIGLSLAANAFVYLFFWGISLAMSTYVASTLSAKSNKKQSSNNNKKNKTYSSSNKTNNSSYSDYSDYKPSYSDYKDSYSDYKDSYSDYSDSSWGGGSSGGGGASGDW